VVVARLWHDYHDYAALATTKSTLALRSLNSLKACPDARYLVRAGGQTDGNLSCVERS
jgi:hypothetical protein